MVLRDNLVVENCFAMNDGDGIETFMDIYTILKYWNDDDEDDDDGDDDQDDDSKNGDDQHNHGDDTPNDTTHPYTRKIGHKWKPGSR